MKVTITQGCSASGKTMWAEDFVKNNPDYVNINRDDIRAALFCDGKLDWNKYKFTKGNEKRVTETQNKMIFDAVMDNKNIIISDTNLNPKYINKFEEMEILKGYEFEYKVFEEDLLTLLERDARRCNGVGYKTITHQYEQFKNMFKSKNHHTFSEDKQDAVIIDVDGTIAKMVSRKPFDWDKVGEDEPRKEIIYMVKGLILQGYAPVFLSGRDACCMDLTQAWIEEQFPELEGHFVLLMRQEGDMRKDTVVKKEIFDKYLNHKYNVRIAIDDRPSVCRMWKHELGLNVVNVGNPYLEF